MSSETCQPFLRGRLNFDNGIFWASSGWFKTFVCLEIDTIATSISQFITQPSIYGVIVYFWYVMSHWTIDQSIFLTFDWHYTMAWLPDCLLKTHRRLSTCVTTMRIRFIYERSRYAAMVKIRHGLATLYSINSVVYYKNWADLVKFSALQQNRIVYSNIIQGTLLSISWNGLGYKTVISCLFVVKSNCYPSVPWTTWCTIALSLVQ